MEAEALRNIGLAVLIAAGSLLASCSGGGFLGGQAGQPASGGGVLNITEPAEEGSDVAAGVRSVAVSGRAQPAAVVSVNGLLVGLDRSGAFRADVALEDELTVIEIVVSDAAGLETRALRVVSRD